LNSFYALNAFGCSVFSLSELILYCFLK
jgi:hypothetical protein